MAKANSSWVLLKSQQDWASYCLAFVCGSKVVTQIAWGSGPREYPCLVASFLPDGGSVVCTAYVYMADAKELTSLETPFKPVQAQVDYALGDNSPSQGDFNKSTSAHLLAIVKLLVDTGIIDQKGYLRRYLAFLSGVDQMAAANLDTMKKNITDHDQGVGA